MLSAPSPRVVEVLLATVRPIQLLAGKVIGIGAVALAQAVALVVFALALPPTAPFAMPALVGFGDATWWQFLLSVVATLACTVVVALAAARVYRTAVLQTGARVRLRELLPTLTR